MKLNISQSRIVGLIYVILITLLIALLYDNTANAGDEHGGYGGDDQQQYQDQWQNQDQQNQQNVSNTSDSRVYAAGASSGDSTSTCQKVRDFRVADGFLAGLRWDVTDQDCRRLDVADKAYARGNTYFADTLYCSTPVILRAFESVDDCKTQLEKGSPATALMERIKQLEEQKATLLRERAIDQEQCEHAKDRIAESKACIGK